MKYITCKNCGANLDPQEVCDCENDEEQEIARRLNSPEALELLDTIKNGLDKLIKSFEEAGEQSEAGVR